MMAQYTEVAHFQSATFHFAADVELIAKLHHPPYDTNEIQEMQCGFIHFF